MKLASLFLRSLRLALSIVTLALSIHLDNVYIAHYYPKHGMPSSARYGAWSAWSGGYGILIAGIGMLLTMIGRAHAILMICLDVLAAVFLLVCGFALVPLHASFDGSGRWGCDVDDSPQVCRHIKKESRVDTATAFLAFLGTVGLLVMAIMERRRVHRRQPSSSS